MNLVKTNSNEAIYNSIGTLIFVTYFIIFVVSNIKYFNQDDFYWGRHIVIILCAFLSFILSYKKALLSLFLLSPLIIIYFIGQQNVYAYMVICVALSAPMLGAGISYGLERHSWKFPGLLLVISFLPVFIDIDTIISSGLFNTGFGRERMDIGYTHPKEGAAPLLVSFILLFLSTYKSIYLRSLLIISSILILYFISSRNSLLYLLVFLYYTLNNYYLKILSIFLFIILGLIILLSGDIYSMLNNFSSERISGWSYALNNTNQIDYINLNSDSRFGYDSFLIETYLMSGILGTIIILLWFFILYLYSPKKYYKYFFLAFFVPLILYSSIDSGIASTGNLVHLFSWSIISFIYCKKYLK